MVVTADTDEEAGVMEEVAVADEVEEVAEAAVAVAAMGAVVVDAEDEGIHAVEEAAVVDTKDNIKALFIAGLVFTEHQA